jgi:cell division protein FtsL
MARAAAVEPVRRAEPARPDLTVVGRRRARRSAITKLGVLAFAALFAAVLGVVVFQTLRAQNQTKLDDLQHQVAAEQDRGKALRLQLADAESPDRITQAAEQRLGMIPPNDVAYLQPKADDDANAAWDPNKDPIPTTTLPPPPTTVAPPPTTVASSGAATGAAGSAGGYRAASGSASSSGSSNLPSSGSSTTKPASATTPTTTKPSTTTPTTTARTTTKSTTSTTTSTGTGR